MCAMFSSAVREQKGVRQRSLVRGNEIQLRSLHRDVAIKAAVIKLRRTKKYRKNHWTPSVF